ncbi:MAG TPA: hypothetical protein VFC07_06640, partial [Verrucomicrobiae bacterium]|nr:hypothetical protein [Verrucomicrobiae bacterium]
MPLALGLVGVGLFAGWYYRWQNITPRMRADFEWFQGLGFPDVKGKAYVRVASGSYSVDEGFTNSAFEYGFLLAANGDKFTVLTSDLGIVNYSNSPSTTPEWERVGFELSDLKVQADEALKLLRKATDSPGVYRRSDGLNTERTCIFTFAYQCWRQGHDHEARELYEEAERYPRPRADNNRRNLQEKLSFTWGKLKAKWENRTNTQPTLKEYLEQDLGDTAYCRATYDFADTNLSRAQLLAEVQSVLRHYPHSGAVTNASNMATVLKRMVAED